jgi:hypothetical protein
MPSRMSSKYSAAYPHLSRSCKPRCISAGGTVEYVLDATVLRGSSRVPGAERLRIYLIMRSGKNRKKLERYVNDFGGLGGLYRFVDDKVLEFVTSSTCIG